MAAPMIKDSSICELVARLDLPRRGWQIVDHWEADLQAVGIASGAEVRRLVYVSSFSRAAGRFSYQCEVPAGPVACDYQVVARGEDVSVDELICVVERHLDAPGRGT